MRLPWPFRRSDPEAGATASVAVGAVQRLEAPVRHDWRVAGTLEPSFVGDPGIRVQRFPDEIAGSQLPSPILAPLGHARTADGPAGLVSGLARPTLAPMVAGIAGRADLPLRPGRSTRHIQRSAAVGTQHPGETQVASGPLAGSPAEPVTGSPLDDISEVLPVLEPRRAVVAATPVSPRGRSLIVARTPDLTLVPSRPPRARISGQPDGERPVVEAGVAPAATIPIPGTPLGGPTRTILRTASGSRVRLGAPIQRSELAAGAPPLELAHPVTRGSSAEHVTHVPVTTSVQRHASPGADHHVPAAPDQDVPDAPLTGELSMTIQDERLASPRAPIEMAPLVPGGLVLARTMVTASDVQAMGQPSDAEHQDDRGTEAPLVGRAPGDLHTPLRPTIPGPTSVPTPIAERRSHASPETGRRSTAQRCTSTRPSVGRSPGRSSTTTARDVAPGPDPGRPVRIMRSSVQTPDVRSPSPPPTGRGGPAALALVRATSSIVADANELGPAARRPALATHVPVQRAAADQLTEPDEPSTSASAAPPLGGGSSAASVPGSSADGSAAVTTIADRDLDEMVRRLYPRLRRSLSSELLVARERAGTLTDLR